MRSRAAITTKVISSIAAKAVSDHTRSVPPKQNTLVRVVPTDTASGHPHHSSTFFAQVNLSTTNFVGLGYTLQAARHIVEHSLTTKGTVEVLRCTTPSTAASEKACMWATSRTGAVMALAGSTSSTAARGRCFLCVSYFFALM